MKKMTASGKAMSMPAGIGLGITLDFLLLIGMLALLAFLVTTDRIQENSVGYGIMTVMLLSAFCGAAAACKLIQHRFVMVAALTGVGYFILLLSMTALLFGGQYVGVFPTSTLIIAGSLTAILLQGRGGKKKHPGGHKKARW